MKNNAILIMLHCEQDTGYAIASLERVFEKSALAAGFNIEDIYWSFSKVHKPGSNVFELKYDSIEDSHRFEKLHSEIRFTSILAFDMPFPNRIAKKARCLGIHAVISYWGASMSSINKGAKLFLKRLEWKIHERYAPIHFVFESQAMRETATLGRGIPEKRTSVVPLGVDIERFYPKDHDLYAHEQFNIPTNRKIIFYSGHMEERKGVRVLIEAMKNLESKKNLEPFHLLICGNKGTESEVFKPLYEALSVKDHITFGGYREDIPELMRSAFVGAIASTGWDSFTMSSVEMLASGLPLIVSELQGLKETIEPGVTGQYIQPGNAEELAEKLTYYVSNPEIYERHRKSARDRAISCFSKEKQITTLSDLIKSLLNQHSTVTEASKRTQLSQAEVD
ncbi:glycosyltransferase family 4 protein [Reinekea blandensis]|uniref:Glycosyltransferase n=1 Tax=Reinekea blandensis MED297 TaxID=314283 RepID=A4B938_9GAMM|nr:glycosyltransferase family 4 protein [Reinekea blandensis]EAR11139.1 Glycosyltransferase [Reinekea sp. MED297] [Reinekea blandensis MED297]